MQIFHVLRDYTKSLEQQKRELKREYSGFQYLFTDSATGKAKIHFLAEKKREE